MCKINKIAIKQLIETLHDLSKEAVLCNIVIDNNVIHIQPIYDGDAIKSNAKIELPNKRGKLDRDNLDRLI